LRDLRFLQQRRAASTLKIGSRHRPQDRRRLAYQPRGATDVFWMEIWSRWPPNGAKGVTDTTLAAIDLEKEPANIKGRELRFCKLTIEPGGIVPWHSHADRPAIIYISEGEIVEYASNCSVPIVHKAGDIRAETSGTSHWWQNLGNKTVVLFVGDVMHDKNDHNM
jgi:quercetin dioxygenase-like cupin family protein